MPNLKAYFLVLLALSLGVSQDLFAVDALVEAKHLDKKILEKKISGFSKFKQNESELAEELNVEKDAEKDAEKDVEKDVEKKLSSLEQSYQNILESPSFQFLDEDSQPQEIKQFGYDLFDQGVLKHQKLQLREYNDNYSLAPGDQLLVSTYGSVDLQLQAEVDHSGDVFFERVGVIHLKGLTFDHAKKLIEKRFENYFLNSQVYISIPKQTTRSVILLGSVKSPGVKQLTGQASLIELLLSSGGINKNGSLRNIRITTKGSSKIVDLYELLLTGENYPTLLTGGESIFIPRITKTCFVFGEILEPGIYELKDHETVNDLILKLTTLSPQAQKNSINIYRGQANSPWMNLVSLDQSTEDEHVLKNSDIIHVLPRKFLIGNMVTIKGAVHTPGSYEYAPKMSLLAVLQKAGGSTRLHGKNILIQRRLADSEYTQLYNKTQTRVDYKLLDIPFSEKAMREFLLEAGDIIDVPSISPELLPSHVSIFGEIAEPGEYDFMQSMNLLHLLTKAGGVSTEAHVEGITISRPISDTQIQQLHFPTGWTTDQVLRSTKLKIGDIVTVPKRESDGVLVSCEGEFVRPGTYLLKKGSKLSDLIQVAGGLKSTAFIEGAAFFRKSVADDFDEQLLKLADQLEEDMIRSQKANTESALESQEKKNLLIYEKQERLINRLRESKSPGRVAIELPSQTELLAAHNSNLKLENGDRLIIGTVPGTVNIIGQVYNPNTLAFNPKLNLSDYLSATGGIKKSADAKNIYVIKANGLIIPAAQINKGSRSGWLTGRRTNDKNELSIRPGDTILVPEDFVIKPNKLQLSRDISQIMFQIIGSLGVIVAAF